MKSKIYGLRLVYVSILEVENRMTRKSLIIATELEVPAKLADEAKDKRCHGQLTEDTIFQ